METIQFNNMSNNSRMKKIYWFSLNTILHRNKNESTTCKTQINLKNIVNDLRKVGMHINRKEGKIK